MRILIAGCGFVGDSLARRLVYDGHRVFGLKRNVSSLPSGVQAVPADLTDAATLTHLPGNIDCLVFMPTPAKRDRDSYTEVFIDGWKNLWNAFGQPPGRSIVVSSTAVYGQSDGSLVNEDSSAVPTGFNGEVLLKLEQLTTYCAENCTIIRCSGIYGPGRDRLIRQAVSADLEIQRSPPHFSNRIHRDDVAGVLRHLLMIETPEPLYLASDNRPTPRYEVLAWLAKQQGFAAPKALVVSGAARGKRVDNQKLRNSGYRMLYPDYRAGYRPLL